MTNPGRWQLQTPPLFQGDQHGQRGAALAPPAGRVPLPVLRQFLRDAPAPVGKIGPDHLGRRGDIAGHELASTNDPSRRSLRPSALHWRLKLPPPRNQQKRKNAAGVLALSWGNLAEPFWSG
jgi:hypothetical protein